MSQSRNEPLGAKLPGRILGHASLCLLLPPVSDEQVLPHL